MGSQDGFRRPGTTLTEPTEFVWTTLPGREKRAGTIERNGRAEKKARPGRKYKPESLSRIAVSTVLKKDEARGADFYTWEGELLY